MSMSVDGALPNPPSPNSSLLQPCHFYVAQVSCCGLTTVYPTAHPLGHPVTVSREDMQVQPR